MSIPEELRGPFPFTRDDLETCRLSAGARHTLAHFHHWRTANERVIADHVDQYTAHLEAIGDRSRLPSRVGHRLRPDLRRRAERLHIAREVVHFGAYNLAETLAPARVEAIVGQVGNRLGTARRILAGLDENRGVPGVIDSLQQGWPALRDVPETRWLAERLDRLHRALPEPVIRAGGMGKVVRTLTGVLAIGVYDTLDSEPGEMREHLSRILPGAYAYGAGYAIVDDTLHDLSDDHLPPRDRERYHALILRGLATGAPVDAAEVPDHPLAEELLELQTVILERYPFERYRHLYHAAESMYLAQDRDAFWRLQTRLPPGVTTLYPDMFIKAAMSRVIANILARRQLDETFYARCVNAIFMSQLRDDLIDSAEDREGDRVTPFTFPAREADTNPLYDLFAYSAYVATEVFGGDRRVADALTHYAATRLGRFLAGARQVDRFTRDYEVTEEIARFVRTARGMPYRARQELVMADQQLKERVARVLGSRNQTTVDCRTFVADRLRYLDDLSSRYLPVNTELGEIVAYAMGGAGKRLRPALGLMLAESLGVDPVSLEPALAAGELFHTASLIFDDLPAHDDATMRRGRPAAHLVFDEGSVQLAALSMISSGFGLLARLDQRYPAHRITEVIGYVGTVLGPERLCLGQHLDLRLSRRPGAASVEEIIRMYGLKTSTALEAALVPLMMVLDRPSGEIELLRRYAHHAGIVFQIRDDVLDATSSAEVLGKDTDNDVGKVNLVRTHGLAEAERLLHAHMSDALRCCEQLPFDTGLFSCVVHHFATRRR
jgi:geranylgeranyl pyrophosphate synthase